MAPYSAGWRGGDGRERETVLDGWDLAHGARVSGVGGPGALFLGGEERLGGDSAFAGGFEQDAGGPGGTGGVRAGGEEGRSGGGAGGAGYAAGGEGGAEGTGAVFCAGAGEVSDVAAGGAKSGEQ